MNMAVDIALEILKASFHFAGDKNLQYKVKTTWCYVDVQNGQTSVRLPPFPIIDHYLSNKEDTIVFLEVWHTTGHSDLGERGDQKFYGLSKCSTRKQLENPQFNPSIQWWDVYNPVHGTTQGKILLKIDAKFSEVLVAEETISEKPILLKDLSKMHPKNASSYFSNGKSTSASHAQSKCQEIQTEISLISLPNDNKKYKNYNNGTTTNFSDIPYTNVTGKNAHDSFNPLAKEVENSGVPNNIASNSGKASATNDPNISRNSNNVSDSVSSRTLSSTFQRRETFLHSVSDIRIKTGNSVCSTISERSSSVENIISLLNDNFDAATEDSVLLYNINKSDKSDYTDFKIHRGYGRQAPDGRNETDSDVNTNRTSSSLQSPVKALSKPKSLNTHGERQKKPLNAGTFQNNSNKYSHQSLQLPAIRPPRMAAALSFADSKSKTNH